MGAGTGYEILRVHLYFQRNRRLVRPSGGESAGRRRAGADSLFPVGIINNAEALVEDYFNGHTRQFMAMSSGKVNSTELTAALINQKDTLVEGIRYAQQVIDGSSTILILTPEGIVAARDRLGRLPVLIGKNEEGCCVSFESFACSMI